MFFTVYTRKNAQVVTSLQTTRQQVRTACSWFVVTSLEQIVNNLQQA